MTIDRVTQLNARVMACVAATAFLVSAAPALAQTYPSKPIRMVIGVPPGGSVDALARVVGKYLSSAVGQPVIIDNRPGGSNKIAHDVVANSAPDGYTVYMMGSSQPQVEASALSVGQPRPYDTLRDLVPVATVATNTYALVVHPSLPVKSVREFIALARARPGQITYGSSGVAKSDHVAGALLEQRTSIKLLHVPYKGLGFAVTDLIAGRVQACFGALPIMAPHIQAGKLRLLGVVASERSFQFPDVPTIAEAVPLKGYAVETWIGIMAPAKTPEAIVTRLNGEINKLLKDDTFVKNGLHTIGLGPWPHTPEFMGNLIRDEVQKYTKLFKDLDIKLE